MDEIKKLTGKRIRELRLMRGLSQAKLAELIDIDQRSLSYIECGGAFPSKCLLKLVGALDVDLSEFFDFSHIDRTTGEMREYIKESIDNLSQENVKTLYRFIKAMK